MASGMFNLAKKQLLDGTLDLINDVIKVCLVTSGYTFNPDNDYLSSASGSEISGTGYQSGFAGTGRKTLSGKSAVESDGTDKAYFDDSADLTWTAINAGTVAAAILYKHLTSDAASVMIAYIDSGGFPVVTNGGDLTIAWNAAGIFEI